MMSKIEWRRPKKPQALECLLEDRLRQRVSPKAHLTVSPTTKLPMPPSPGRRIDPESAEGKAIAAKYGSALKKQ